MRSFRIISLFLLIVCVIVLRILISESSFSYRLSSKTKLQLKSNYSRIIEAAERKYITSSFNHPSGLGNQLFRFAALYGMGKDLNREPYYNASVASQMEEMKAISVGFPAIHDLIHIKNPDKSLVKLVKVKSICCSHEHLEPLKKIPEKYIAISDHYLQSYYYFHKYRSEIKTAMECGPEIKNKVDSLARQILKPQSNHKFCIHTRRGDFVDAWMLESETDFIRAGVKYVFDTLPEVRKSTGVVFGEDIDFIKNLYLDNYFDSVVTFSNYSNDRILDLCFAIEQCETLFMTASSSTFGWWMAYLKKNPGNVYLNAVSSDDGLSPKDEFDYDLFLPEWKRLLFNKRDGLIRETDLWFFQRVGVTGKLGLG